MLPHGHRWIDGARRRERPRGTVEIREVDDVALANRRYLHWGGDGGRRRLLGLHLWLRRCRSDGHRWECCRRLRAGSEATLVEGRRRWRAIFGNPHGPRCYLRGDGFGGHRRILRALLLQVLVELRLQLHHLILKLLIDRIFECFLFCGRIDRRRARRRCRSAGGEHRRRLDLRPGADRRGGRRRRCLRRAAFHRHHHSASPDCSHQHCRSDVERQPSLALRLDHRGERGSRNRREEVGRQVELRLFLPIDSFALHLLFQEAAEIKGQIERGRRILAAVRQRRKRLFQIADGCESGSGIEGQ